MDKEQKQDIQEQEVKPVATTGEIKIDETSENTAENQVSKKKKKKFTPFLKGNKCQIHIKATYNNTLITATDLNGAVLNWGSAGKSGFKGPKKSTPYAAGIITKSVIEKIKDFGIKEADVFVKSTGNGREAAIRAIETNGIKIASIKDVTPVQHGGCRPKKRRRV